MVRFGHIWQQRQMSGPFNSGGQLPLMPGAGPRNPSRDNFSSVGDETAQPAIVLVVDILDFIAAEPAGFPKASPLAIH